MKISVICEFGKCGFGFNRKVFDIYPTKWFARAAIGFAAITVVCGDTSAIRAFSLS